MMRHRPAPRATPDAWLRLGEVVMLTPADDTEAQPPIVAAANLFLDIVNDGVV